MIKINIDSEKNITLYINDITQKLCLRYNEMQIELNNNVADLIDALIEIQNQ